MFASPCHVNDSLTDDAVCNRRLWELMSYRQDKKVIGRKILCRLMHNFGSSCFNFQLPFPFTASKQQEK